MSKVYIVDVKRGDKSPVRLYFTNTEVAAEAITDLRDLGFGVPDKPTGFILYNDVKLATDVAQTLL